MNSSQSFRQPQGGTDPREIQSYLKIIRMSLDENFQKAAEDVKNLKTKPSDQELLEIYGLFKQGSIGDVNTSRPGLLDLKGKAKWDAWNGRKGLSQDEAKELYIDKVKSLIDSIGLK